jgi:hypothetical protein
VRALLVSMGAMQCKFGLDGSTSRQKSGYISFACMWATLGELADGGMIWKSERFRFCLCFVLHILCVFDVWNNSSLTRCYRGCRPSVGRANPVMGKHLCEKYSVS